jgi:hypothetical protein
MTWQTMMRESIEMIGFLNTDITPTVAEPEPVVSVETCSLEEDLNILITRLREYSDPEGGEFSLGVETGMVRAADMLENLIRRHGDTKGEIGNGS